MCRQGPPLPFFECRPLPRCMPANDAIGTTDNEFQIEQISVKFKMKAEVPVRCCLDAGVEHSVTDSGQSQMLHCIVLHERSQS